MKSLESHIFPRSPFRIVSFSTLKIIVLVIGVMTTVGEGRLDVDPNSRILSAWGLDRPVRYDPAPESNSDYLGIGYSPNDEVRPQQIEMNGENPGQCDTGWKPGTPVNGVDGWVSAIAADGAGNVYVGGSITAAGDSLVRNIAKWDGTKWSALGAGINGWVTSIAISGADVYVGGVFTAAGGVQAEGIARWNGSSWSPIGSGPGHSVDALAVWGTILYAGGMTGGPEFSGAVSVWNGSAWSRLGQVPISVSDIEVYGADVYVSRDGFGSVYRWNGSAWTSIGSLSMVRDMAVSGSYLYAVGRQYLGPFDGEVGHVSRWDGSSWTTLASGLVHGSSKWGAVYSVAASGTDVYISGLFSNVEGVAAIGVARWDGTSWSGIGNWQTATSSIVATSGGDVYFGGEFVSVERGGDRRADGIAKWDGEKWSDLGEGIYTVPNAMAVSGSDVYAAGYFTDDGGSNVDRLVKWSGTNWQPVTSSFPSGPPGWALTIRALVVSGPNFYVGGYWTSPNKQSSTGFVYKWNGTSWTELGGGMNGQVTALAVSEPDLYAGGRFTAAGQVNASRVAKWNGVAWQPLGSGILGHVVALALAGKDLYAAGDFGSAGNVSARNLAKWDGAEWSALGSGPMRPLRQDAPQTGFTSVTSIVVSGSDVYAGGGWDLSDYEDIGFVSKWNGSEWSEVVACCGYVNSLTIAENELYIGRGNWGGDVVVKWDGSTVSDLGFDNTSDWGSAGIVHNVDGEIFVGSGFHVGMERVFVSGDIEGGFSKAGCHVSANFAWYSKKTYEISGRILTPAGSGLRGTLVTLTDSSGVKRSTLTSTLGYYTFSDLLTGEITIRASSRRFRFQPVTRTIVGSLNDVDLIGVE